MKTRFLIAVFLLFCLSCSNNKPLSDKAKEKVISEVKVVMDSIVKGIDQVKTDVLTGAALSSPEFTFQVNGMTGNYDLFTKAVSGYFNPLASQKIEIFNERYAVLDKSNVLYSANCRCEVNYKDGKVTSQDPWAMQFLFRKKGSQWKFVSWTEYGSEKIVKAGNSPENLNQLELLRQFTGTWKSDGAVDTVFIWEVRPYGKSLTVAARTLIKGKTIDEETGVFAYDPTSEKIIQTRVSKNAGSLIAPLWFTSKNTAETVFIENMTHPESAASKGIFNLVSPTEMTFTVRNNDKVFSMQKYKLVAN